LKLEQKEKLESKIILFDYLTKYPLFGYKYFSQINLEKIHYLNLSKEYKTIEGIIKLNEHSNMKYDINKQFS
jgi:hypothetical protein